MTARRITTGVTLLVLLVVLGAMAVYGFRAATAPLPGSSSSSSKKQDCSAAEKSLKTTITRKEVQVSVFNASDRRGLASRTLAKLEDAGFRAGNVGNAPKGARVARVTVWTTKQDDPAAQLVARAFGKKTPVVVAEQDLGPGIDVLLGNGYKRLAKKAPKKLKLAQPVETCVPVK